MFVLGIVLLVVGKISIAPNYAVRGVMARVIGVVLMMPLAFGVGFVLGFVLTLRGHTQAQIRNEILGPLSVIEAALTVGCAVLAVLLGIVAPKKLTRRRRSRDFDDDEYYDDFPDDRPENPRIVTRRAGDRESPPRVRRRPPNIEGDDRPS
jgi:hypothetical protein